MATILEGGVDMEVTQEQTESLIRQGMIYFCDVKDGGCFSNGEGCGFYHVSNDVVDAASSNVEMWEMLAKAAG